MKRFTETTKWRDPWFRRLSPLAKLLWSYLTDNCNSVGLIDLDMEAAAFDIGKLAEEAVGQKHLDELVSRLTMIGDGKLFIPKFIPFQYGRLSVACPAHKPILTLIEQLHLEPTDIGYGYPSDKVTIGNGDGISTPSPRDTPVSTAAVEIATEWNKAAESAGLAQCVGMSTHRRKSLNARLKEPFFRDNWKVALAKLAASEFCRGKNDRGWKADFDFFIQPDAVIKIMEGKYDPRVPHGTPSQLTHQQLASRKILGNTLGLSSPDMTVKQKPPQNLPP